MGNWGELEAIFKTVAAAVAAAGSIAGALAGSAWYAKLKKRRRQANYVSTRVKALSELFQPLNELTLAVGACRGLLIVAENGSKFFPTYITVTWQVRTKPCADRLEGWDRYKVDASYEAKIGRAAMSAQDFELITTEELPSGSLRDSYEADCIIGTIICPILKSQVDEWAVYASLNLADIPNIDVRARDQIRTHVMTLRRILRDSTPL